MSNYRNTVFYDFKSQFLVIFPNNYRHRLVLEIQLPEHILPKTSKNRTENLHFPSTGKYYTPAPKLKNMLKKVKKTEYKKTQ